MAEETLRRNLTRAFDPGPDFPDPLLLSRTMAALSAPDVADSPRKSFRLALGRRTLGLIAVLTLIAVLAVSAGAFIAINLSIHRSIPVHPAPFKVRAAGAAVCNFRSSPPAQSCEISDAVFVSPSVGFVLEGTTVAVCSATCPLQTVVVFRTRDAGLHWEPVYTTKLDCCQQLSRLLTSADGKQILVLGPATSTSTLAFSSDGGATWESRRLPSGARAASQTACGPAYKGGKCFAEPLAPAVYFLDPRHGWVVSQEQSFGVADLFRTSDGGAKWTLATKIDITKEFGLSLNNDPLADGTRQDANLRGQFVFRGTSLAWFVPFGSSLIPPGSALPDSLTLFRSTDGGVSWTPEKIAVSTEISAGDPGVVTLKFFNDQQGILEVVVNPRTGPPGCVAATCGGTIVERRFVYTTSDGGLNWSRAIAVPQPTYYESMRFIDADHWVGWPYSGGWISTSDAGQHWQVVAGVGQFGEPPAPGAGLPGQLPADYPVHSIYGFLDASHGWALPYQASDPNVRGLALFFTVDGGLNWYPASLPELGGS
jgi:photosystem II stability/assembly factor-like uncharacterized protein